MEKYGYPGESHDVQTEDGYTLTIHRIPYGRNNTKKNRPVVLLQHGIVLSSDQWVLRGTDDLGMYHCQCYHCYALIPCRRIPESTLHTISIHCMLSGDPQRQFGCDP